MTFWRHNACTQCWSRLHPVPLAVAIRDIQKTKCCFCGEPNRDGITVRYNGHELRCNGNCSNDGEEASQEKFAY